METRTANMIISSAGGTAGKGSKTYKLSLPSAWVRQMGLDSQDRQLQMYFDGKSIQICKAQSPAEFAAQQHALGHDVRLLNYYNGAQLCTRIYADFTQQLLKVENLTDRLVKTAFGVNGAPSWQDFQSFLAERCIPRSRAGIREYLETLGLEEYDPFAIICRTQGRMAEDQQWIEVNPWP